MSHMWHLMSNMRCFFDQNKPSKHEVSFENDVTLEICLENDVTHMTWHVTWNVFSLVKTNLANLRSVLKMMSHIWHEMWHVTHESVNLVKTNLANLISTERWAIAGARASLVVEWVRVQTVSWKTFWIFNRWNWD